VIRDPEERRVRARRLEERRRALGWSFDRLSAEAQIDKYLIYNGLMGRSLADEDTLIAVHEALVRGENGEPHFIPAGRVERYDTDQAGRRRSVVAGDQRFQAAIRRTGGSFA
jgi:hypothetical protein